jgi:glycosyltransferase involved in cell wall biosynthesis
MLEEHAYPLNSRKALSPIICRYLLVIGVEHFRDEAGRTYLDGLWYKDLIEHFRYLKNITIASPCAYQKPPKGAVRIDNDPLFEEVRFVDLPRPTSVARALIDLPSSLRVLWKAIGDADIVHSGVAGWPIPLGWLTTPIVIIRKKKYLIVVESAFWRVQPGSRPTVQARIRGRLSEILSRWCVNRADLSIFTQPEYKRSLLTKGEARGHVINASWIDEENIISHADARESWAKKRIGADGKLKIIFVGRLVAAKGILVLLEAMKKSVCERVPVDLDILGDGDQLESCHIARDALKHSAQIRLLGTVPYGEELFELLRGYHAVVAPVLSDEQPRIVYDAYSQAVPVIASDTDGLRSCVENGTTGMLVNSNDHVALAHRLKWAQQNPEQLKLMGLAALDVARRLTHRAMHEKRWTLLLKLLSTTDH